MILKLSLLLLITYVFGAEIVSKDPEVDHDSDSVRVSEDKSQSVPTMNGYPSNETEAYLSLARLQEFIDDTESVKRQEVVERSKTEDFTPQVEDKSESIAAMGGYPSNQAEVDASLARLQALIDDTESVKLKRVNTSIENYMAMTRDVKEHLKPEYVGAFVVAALMAAIFFGSKSNEFSN
jgi:hypothetical protein